MDKPDQYLSPQPIQPGMNPINMSDIDQVIRTLLSLSPEITDHENTLESTRLTRAKVFYQIFQFLIHTKGVQSLNSSQYFTFEEIMNEMYQNLQSHNWEILWETIKIVELLATNGALIAFWDSLTQIMPKILEDVLNLTHF